MVPPVAPSVNSLFRTSPSRFGSNEQLGVELWPSLWAVRHEPHDGVADLHRRGRVGHGQQLAKGRRLELRIVGAQLELGEPQILSMVEQLLEPVARWVQLEPVARVRRDERAAAAVLLDAQVAHLRPRERGDELVVIECEAEVVDAR
jgi:hypothetical protein